MISILKSRFKNIARRILKSKLIMPLWVLYFALCIKKFDRKQISRKSKIRVIALNHKRWNQDLEALNKNSDIQILILPEKIQDILGTLFLYPLREKISYENQWEIESIEYINKFQEEYKTYLITFLKKLKNLIKIDCIISCTFYYRRDKAWEKASQFANIPYISIHKECMKDQIVIKKMIKRYLERRYSFSGSNIIVYNENEKKCLIEGGVTKSKKIKVLGCMRMDKYFKEAKEIKPLYKHCITLFSFRPTIGGIEIKDDIGGFSKSNKNGAIDYFNSVHSTIALFAKNNPEIQVYIKTKWKENWIERIQNVINKELQMNLKDIKNLCITADINSYELIKKSSIIIGANSTCLIEAIIFKRLVIIPILAEMQNKYKDYLYFQKYFSQNFITPRSKEELTKILNKTILNSPTYIDHPDQIIYDFLGYKDGRSVKRIAEFIKSQCN